MLSCFLPRNGNDSGIEKEDFINKVKTEVLREIYNNESESISEAKFDTKSDSHSKDGSNSNVQFNVDDVAEFDSQTDAHTQNHNNNYEIDSDKFRPQPQDLSASHPDHTSGFCSESVSEKSISISNEVFSEKSPAGNPEVTRLSVYQHIPIWKIIIFLLLLSPISEAGIRLLYSIVIIISDAYILQFSNAGVDSLKCFILVILHCLYVHHYLMVVVFMILFNG
jgi:hypothetical protein